jgi:hypothetical protein
MPKRKIETHTARPLKTPKQVGQKDPIQELLKALHALALDGNTTAAKLYLDYMLKQNSDEPNGMTPEEALRILREQNKETANEKR